MFATALRKVEARLRDLPTGLIEHVERAREQGRLLARRYGLDVWKVDLALAAHDLARALTEQELLAEARRLCMQVSMVEDRAPILLHGPIAARWLREERICDDPEIIESVRFHTTGAPGIGRIARAVFLADKLDPEKIGNYPYLESVRNASVESLDLAVLSFLDQQFSDFLRGGQVIHPQGVAFRNELVIGLSCPP